MLVDELGGETVTRMLLGGLDVQVDHGLRLEPLITALVWAGERSQASMVQQMHLGSIVRGISLRATSVGAWELRRHGSVLRNEMTFQLINSCKGCPTLLAKVRSQPQVDCVSVLLKIRLVREGQPTGGALERLLLEVDCTPMSLQ